MATAKHKHDMTIYYGQNYSIIDRSGDKPTVVDYSAIVAFPRYNFKQINSLNVFIMTPAQQVVYNLIDGKSELSRYALLFLKETAGEKGEGWDINERETALNPDIFFKRRKDALAFIKKIQYQLDGIKVE